MTDDRKNEELHEKGLNAPRLNPQHIDDTICSEYYHVVPDTTLTICVLTLKNGFTVVGESTPPIPLNFDEEIGRKFARTNARDKIWMLEGYLLKQKLFEAN